MPRYRERRGLRGSGRSSKQPRGYKSGVKEMVKLLGNGVTSDKQLTRVGKQVLGEDYLGTFPVDKLPKKLPNKTYFIVNNKGSRSGGEHWSAVCKEDDVFYICDSFGRSSSRLMAPLVKDIQGRGYTYRDTEKDVEQLDSEDNCGARSMSALLVAKKHGVREFLKI